MGTAQDNAKQSSGAASRDAQGKPAKKSGPGAPDAKGSSGKKSTGKSERPLVVAAGKDTETSRRHLQEVLEAKQERARSGPSYPPSNAHTGRSDAGGPGEPPRDGVDVHAADGQGTQPSPDALFGSGNVAHARGNQGMRKQR